MCFRETMIGKGASTSMLANEDANQPKRSQQGVMIDKDLHDVNVRLPMQNQDHMHPIQVTTIVG